MDRCVSYTGRCQPRGKNDESVPNNRRSGPSVCSVWANTVRRVNSGWYWSHRLELEVSRCRLVGRHQCFLQEPGAEVRNDDRHGGIPGGHRYDGQRITEPNVDRGP